MSVETFLVGEVFNRANQDSLLSSIQELISTIKDTENFRSKPEVLLRSGRGKLSTTHPADELILQGFIVPKKHRATVKDFNVNFVGTPAGKVSLVILDANGNIVDDIILEISNNQSGIGDTVIEQDQSLAIIGNTSGAGVFGVYCSGILQRVAD